MSAIDKLTDAQVLALARFSKQEGVRWRVKLAECFETGHYPKHVEYMGTAAFLQQVRNRHGVSFLRKLDSREIDAQGATVAHEWGVPL